MYNISLITGDGIGPELSESAISVLETIHDKLDVKTKINSLEAGDVALEKYMKALPDETCLLYTSPSPRDMRRSRMPSSA